MLAPMVHLLPLTSFRRERLLPAKGRVLVRTDQRVGSLDLVAEARQGHSHQLIDVARLLGIRIEAAQQMIQVKAGDLINKGEFIAQRKGLVPLTLKAPEDGRVVLVGRGRILIESDDGVVLLHAGVPGRISRVIPERGVEIAFNGAWVQGVWGNNRLNLGLLMPLTQAAEDVLSVEMLDVSLRGAVVMAGTCCNPAVLQAAAALPVRGMILGSLDPQLVETAEKMEYPLVVVDGFGMRGMDSAAFRLLATNAKREVTLNSNVLDRHSGQRPEILIPLPAAEDLPRAGGAEEFTPGQTVRLARAPQAGAIGTILSLPAGMSPLPSGLRAPAAEVNLESGETIIVPLVNLEVLG